jgi:hypothetical protein
VQVNVELPVDVRQRYVLHTAYPNTGTAKWIYVSMWIDVGLPAAQEGLRTVVAREFFFRVSFDELRKLPGRSTDEPGRKRTKHFGYSPGSIVVGQCVDVNGCVQKTLLPDKYCMGTENLAGDPAGSPYVFNRNVLLVKGIAADQELVDSEALDLSEPLPGRCIIRAPEAVCFEFIDGQHALLFRDFEAVEQMLIVHERLSPGEVKVLSAAPKHLQLLKDVSEIVKAKQSALSRTAVDVACCALGGTAVAQHDPDVIPESHGPWP